MPQIGHEPGMSRTISGCIEQVYCVARDLAQVHLFEVRRKMMELQELQRTLEGYIDACDQICLGGPASNCSIFEDLGIARQKSTPIAGCCGAQAKA